MMMMSKETLTHRSKRFEVPSPAAILWRRSLASFLASFLATAGTSSAQTLDKENAIHPRHGTGQDHHTRRPRLHVSGNSSAAISSLPFSMHGHGLPRGVLRNAWSSPAQAGLWEVELDQPQGLLSAHSNVVPTPSLSLWSVQIVGAQSALLGDASCLL